MGLRVEYHSAVAHRGRRAHRVLPVNARKPLKIMRFYAGDDLARCDDAMNLTRRTLFPMLGAVALFAATAEGRPPRHPAPPPPRPAPTAPTFVPTDVTTMQNNLRRLRIYVVYGPETSTAFGAQGVGSRVWFVLPSCRPQDNGDVVDACPIERLVLEARGGGAVTPAPMTTVLDGAVPRRVQAFVVSSQAQLVSVRLINQRGEVRYEGVVEARQLRELPRPEGRPLPDGSFALDFARYPAR
jgi:hypothetical protein